MMPSLRRLFPGLLVASGLITRSVMATAWSLRRLFVGLVLAGSFLAAAPLRGSEPDLPRFTEEREAAGLHFVKKHLPELLPLLDELQKNNKEQYQRQMREIFRTTEMLADLFDEPKRHDLELKIWKAENRAFVAIAKLSSAKDNERKALESQIHELARELVDLDIHSLEARVEMIERDLAESREEVARLRDNLDKAVKERYDSLLERVKKRKKVP
jgi:hypothetical protein